MIEHIHDFQLLSHFHATIEEIRGDPKPRTILVSRFRGMAERQEKEVGVFPSSFNPITQGHMAILRGAAEVRALREILLALDTQAMDKEIFGATLGDRLFACCTFMVANRGNHGRKAVQRLMALAENRRFKDKVHFFEIPNHLTQISSARVRQRVREGKAFARLVPSQGGEFIEEAKLYKADREVGPQGQRINLYDPRTQALCQLYALYQEGRSGIDVGERVDKVVAGMRGGQRLETLLDSLPEHILGGRGERFGNA